MRLVAAKVVADPAVVDRIVAMLIARHDKLIDAGSVSSLPAVRDLEPGCVSRDRISVE